MENEHEKNIREQAERAPRLRFPARAESDLPVPRIECVTLRYPQATSQSYDLALIGLDGKTFRPEVWPSLGWSSAILRDAIAERWQNRTGWPIVDVQ